MNFQSFIWLAKTLLGLAKHLPSGKRLRVLIVEHEDDTAEQLTSYCAEAGVETLWVRTLEAAEEVLKRETFRLLLLDLQMPANHVLDFARKIRPRYPKLPVVLMTAHLRDVNTLPQGRKWSFILKGADGGSLMEAVNDALASSNGVNGDYKSTDLFVVAWCLFILSTAGGFGLAWFLLHLPPK